MNQADGLSLGARRQCIRTGRWDRVLLRERRLAGGSPWNRGQVSVSTYMRISLISFLPAVVIQVRVDQ
jgi:hypothetical protein